MSHHTGRARKIADLIAQRHAALFDTWFRFTSQDEYRGPHGLLTLLQAQMPEGHPLKTHRTSPFVWIETAEPVEGAYKPEGRDCYVLPLGGRDRFCEWVHKQPVLEQDEQVRALATEPSVFDAWVNEAPGTSQQQQKQ